MSTIQISPQKDKYRKSVEVSIEKSTEVSQNKYKNKSPNKIDRQKEDSKSESLNKNSKQSKRKKVTWSKAFVDTINVISFKKYNIENTHDDPNFPREKIKCKCIIF